MADTVHSEQTASLLDSCTNGGLHSLNYIAKSQICSKCQVETRQCVFTILFLC